jgi:hypothetical protein
VYEVLIVSRHIALSTEYRGIVIRFSRIFYVTKVYLTIYKLFYVCLGSVDTGRIQS